MICNATRCARTWIGLVVLYIYFIHVKFLRIVYLYYIYPESRCFRRSVTTMGIMQPCQWNINASDFSSSLLIIIIIWSYNLFPYWWGHAILTCVNNLMNLVNVCCVLFQNDNRQEGLWVCLKIKRLKISVNSLIIFIIVQESDKPLYCS